MAAKITYDQYVQYLCERANLTVAQLFADLDRTERKIVPCDCDEDICQGWQCAWPTPEEELAKMGDDQWTA